MCTSKLLLYIPSTIYTFSKSPIFQKETFKNIIGTFFIYMYVISEIMDEKLSRCSQTIKSCLTNVYDVGGWGIEKKYVIYKFLSERNKREWGYHLQDPEMEDIQAYLFTLTVWGEVRKHRLRRYPFPTTGILQKTYSRRMGVKVNIEKTGLGVELFHIMKFRIIQQEWVAKLQ